jgi:hypothetical protein
LGQVHADDASRHAYDGPPVRRPGRRSLLPRRSVSDSNRAFPADRRLLADLCMHGALRPAAAASDRHGRATRDSPRWVDVGFRRRLFGDFVHGKFVADTSVPWGLCGSVFAAWSVYAQAATERARGETACRLPGFVGVLHRVG